MKLLSRNLTKKEKILVAVLGIMLLGLLYYRLVWVNVNDAITSARSEASSIQSELDVAKARVAKIEKMKAELVDNKMSSKMGSYNNSKPETVFLNTVLSGVPDYSISFDEVTREGDQIRRNFTLQFKVSSYEEAEAIMKALTSGEYRCLIGDVNCAVGNDGTSISLIGTFYETMVGGTADSALPKDEAETAEAVELSDFE